MAQMGKIDCTFGILKGCWNIWKTVLRVQGVKPCDKVWLTCCALYNMLLEIDELDKEWEYVVPPVMSEWEGALGEVDTEGLYPTLLSWLWQSICKPELLMILQGAGKDVANIIEERHPVDIDLDENTDCKSLDYDVRIVGKLGLGSFRSCLVEHFDILFKQNKIKWPPWQGKQLTAGS
ncbi:LOW QUALITY PROTEIN: hypothetical protein ACHAWX_000407 [Stephanocyclus meneghinianus]